MAQIISSDTTWTTGSSITLTSNIQIAHGVTLTIQPGVDVQGNGFTIQTFGVLNAEGSAGSAIHFQNTKFTFSANINQPGRISIDNSVLTGGSFLASTGNASYGSWSITNSTLVGLPAIYAWYPVGNVLISGNVFQDDGGISIGIDSKSFTISNNTFSGWRSNIYSTAAIENWAAYGTSLVSIQNNNFLDAGRVALELLPDYTSTAITATGNYFGTTDGAIIASMIYDQNVDLNSAGIIPNLNIASSANVICFCKGTLIDTPNGTTQVEKLKIGETVSTAHHGPRPIKWIGKGKVVATRGTRTAATPVIVCKGAIADNVPNQDLHLTKAHSLYIDGVFIPVEFLVNHKTINWDDRVQGFEIYHIELDSHDVIMANGAATETYRDDGNRWLFENTNAGWGAPREEPYAPVLTGGALVDAIWRRLLDRAGARALPPITDDPDVHLLVDGMRLDARKIHGKSFTFQIDKHPNIIQIVSREAIPAELGLVRDPRSLGVALRRLTVRQDTGLVIVNASDERLVDGFHCYESANDLRWTNGNARLPAELSSQFFGPMELTLQLTGINRYVLFGGNQQPVVGDPNDVHDDKVVELVAV